MTQKSSESSKVPADIEQMLQDQAKHTLIKEAKLEAKQLRALDKAASKKPPVDSAN